MQIIQSPADFEALFARQRAVLFVYFSWSSRAAESLVVFREWENKLAAEETAFDVYQISPDECPWAWKWLNESLVDDHDNAAPISGCVAWLQRGAVVGRVDDAAMAGAKGLARITRAYFGEGESGGIREAELNSGILQILCCPETHQKLKAAPSALITTINERIAAGRLQNRGGQPIRDPIDGGLVRADGKYLYLMRQNIPVLLVDESIPLAGIKTP